VWSRGLDPKKELNVGAKVSACLNEYLEKKTAGADDGGMSPEDELALLQREHGEKKSPVDVWWCGGVDDDDEKHVLERVGQTICQQVGICLYYHQ
jgi:hypothetical protein